MPSVTFTADYSFLIETSLGWLVLATFTAVWAYVYYQGNGGGVIGKLLALKNAALSFLFIHMAISAWWIAFTQTGTTTNWLFQNYRRVSLGITILAYVILQVEIYRQKYGQRNKNND